MNLKLASTSATWYHPVSNQEVGVAEGHGFSFMYLVGFIVPGCYRVGLSLVIFTFCEREERASHALLCD